MNVAYTTVSISSDSFVEGTNIRYNKDVFDLIIPCRFNKCIFYDTD